MPYYSLGNNSTSKRQNLNNTRFESLGAHQIKRIMGKAKAPTKAGSGDTANLRGLDNLA
jgi:hypothetical protein